MGMFKRMRGLLPFMVLCLCLAPATAWAGDNEAAVGTVAYETVHDAVLAAQPGETVRLLKDVKLADESDDFIEIDKTITLDLGGYTLTSSDEWYAVQVTDGAATVQNGIIDGYRGVGAWGGSVTLDEVSIDVDNLALALLHDAKAKVGATAALSSQAGACVGLWSMENESGNTLHPSVDVYGTLRGKLGIQLYGANEVGTTVNIYDGAIVNGSSVGIYSTIPATVNVYGGEVKGQSAVSLRAGALNVKGGALTAEGQKATETIESQEKNIVYTGATIMVDSFMNTYRGDIAINIEDGVITSANDVILQEIGNTIGQTLVGKVNISGGAFMSAAHEPIFNVRDVVKEKIAVTGGSFSASVADYVQGLSYELNDGGNYSYHASLAQAQAAANNADAIITQIANDEPVNPPSESLPFTDVAAGDWFYDDVVYAYGKGLMNGTDTTTFAPNNTTTRAMVVTMLYRMEGEPAVSAAVSFEDVATDAYYNKAVAWASQNDIVSGMSDTTFAPNNAITREQMASVLYRYAQYKGIDTSTRGDLSKFSDASAVSSYAEHTLSWANGVGLIGGMTDGTIAPQAGATRAQVAAIMTRLCTEVLA